MTNLQKYIHAALKKAKYVLDEDTNNFIGYIEELPLCWAQGDTIEDVREELESVVEGWILLSIRSGESLPIISNTHFNIPSKASTSSICLSSSQFLVANLSIS